MKSTWIHEHKQESVRETGGRHLRGQGPSPSWGLMKAVDAPPPLPTNTQCANTHSCAQFQEMFRLTGVHVPKAEQSSGSSDPPFLEHVTRQHGHLPPTGAWGRTPGDRWHAEGKKALVQDRTELCGVWFIQVIPRRCFWNVNHSLPTFTIFNISMYHLCY